jgi:membrane protein YqaA with SNARE-associated domain
MGCSWSTFSLLGYKDALAIQLKLNEIVAALHGASNRMISVEQLSERDLQILQKHYGTLSKLASADSEITESLRWKKRNAVINLNAASRTLRKIGNTMSRFFSLIFALFLSPFGLVALAALDSSMVFFMPAAVDMAVIILTARYREFFWAFPILATAGSLAGAYATFQIGCKIGENSLGSWVPERRLRSVQKKIKDKGAIALALPGLVPPPFPLTPFILACGALKVSRMKFFLTLGAARIFRFEVVAVLAFVYGKRIAAVIDSNIFKTIIAAFIAIALAGTAYSAYRVVRTTRSHRATSNPEAA